MLALKKASSKKPAEVMDDNGPGQPEPIWAENMKTSG